MQDSAVELQLSLSPVQVLILDITGSKSISYAQYLPICICALVSQTAGWSVFFFFFFLFPNRCLDSYLHIRQNDHTGNSKKKLHRTATTRGTQDADSSSMPWQGSQGGVGGPHTHPHPSTPPWGTPWAIAQFSSEPYWTHWGALWRSYVDPHCLGGCDTRINLPRLGLESVLKQNLMKEV